MQRRFLMPIVVILAVLFSGQDCKTGVVTHEEGALDGYTLLSDYLGQQAVLIDMDGNVVNEWPMVVFPAKMLPGGYVIGGGDRFNSGSMVIAPDTLELVQYNWQGDVVETFCNWDDQGTGTMMARQHHDFEREGSPTGYYAPGQAPMVRGKTLVLGHKDVYIPEITTQGTLQDDVLYEIDADGALTGFEWHASQHFNDLGLDDDAKAGLQMDANCEAKLGLCDYLHTNVVSYLGPNPWYDAGDERFNPSNIIIDSRNANYLIIISKETGDVVWRVGPDYSEGTPEHGLGQIQGPHHTHMIPGGLPGGGDILVFDNGAESGYGGPNGYPEYQPRGWSRVLEFNPVTLEVVWEYGADPGDEQFYSQYISSAQRLPNGNTLITVGMEDRVFEVTPDKRLVWDYRYNGNKMTYRAYRVPPEWLPEGQNYAGYANWGSPAVEPTSAPE